MKVNTIPFASSSSSSSLFASNAFDLWNIECLIIIREVVMQEKMYGYSDEFDGIYSFKNLYSAPLR